MTIDEEIKMKRLEFDLALEKAYRTIDHINALAEQARIVYKLTFDPVEEIKPWWIFWK